MLPLNSYKKWFALVRCWDRLKGFRWSRALLGFALVILVSSSLTSQPAIASIVKPNGTVLLNTGPIQFSPPTLADLDGDGRPETILVGTNDGKAVAVRLSSSNSNLTTLWSHDTAADMGCPTGIHGAISAGDLDGDGKMEVVVPIGAVNETGKCGGIVVLDGLSGRTLWHYHTLDLMHNADGQGGPDGLSDMVVSTPALADIDRDGKLEIIFGSFDQHIHALRSDGTLVSGAWPVFVRDTVWSSAAIADLDKDGYPEIAIGVDAHYEPGLPNSAPNGGCVFAFRRDGSVYWRQCINQVVYSAIAIGDLDGDGALEIVHGTGEFFQTPEGQAAGYKIYVRDALGNIKWTGSTGSYTREAPALGDINGDGKLEVVAVSLDHRLHAWKSDGTKLWEVAPKTYQGNNWTLSAPAIAHYPGENNPVVYTNTGWESAVLRGTTGTQLTASKWPDYSWPTYLSGYSTSGNAPAVGDIDGDGKLELVLASANNQGTQGQVDFWRLNATNTPAAVPWPMFQHNARHTGSAQSLRLAVVPQSIYLMHQLGDSQSEQMTMTIQADGGGSMAWTIAVPQGVTANPSSGTTSTSAQATLTISTAGRSLGTHAIGNVTVTATSGSNPVPGSPATIPVTLHIVQQLYRTRLPGLFR